MVGTTKKSREMISKAWFFKNVFQRCRAVREGFLGMYRCIVASEISIPSFSISPWIRGAPQRGFSFAICLIRLICACGIAGLPSADLLFHLQYSLKPCRCHRTTVSGLTISSVVFQELKRLVRMPKKNLSEGRNRGLVDERASISSCFLRYTISSWSCVLDLRNRRQNDRSDRTI